MSTRVIRVTVDGRTTTVRTTDPARVLNVGIAGPAGADGEDGAAGQDGADGAPGDSFVPDPTAEPDDRWLTTLDGTLVYTDAPDGGGGAVDSVNGETGVVVLDATDVGADAAGAAATAQAAAEATAASALSTHAADATSVHGIADTSALVLTDDARLTDDRDPNAHAASHQDGGADELALDGSQITSGTVADARIASTIARDSEVTSAVSTHEGLSDPHPGYLTTAEGAAAYQPVDSDLTAIAALTTTSFGRALLATADASALRTAAGLILGTDVYSKSAVDSGFQPLDSDLTAIAALTTTSYGRALLAVADLAALRTILGPTGTPSSTTFLRGDGTWNTPAGGGGGATASVRRATGSGMTVAANTSWNDLNTSLDLTLAAATGDWVTATVLGAWSNTGSSFGCLDVVTVVSAAPVNSFIMQGAPDNTAFSYGMGGVQNAFTQIGATIRYQLQSGDISGGNVLLRLRVRTSSAVAKSIHCSATEPFIFSARIN